MTAAPHWCMSTTTTRSTSSTSRQAIVIDRYRNHQVLIDPVTKEPTEPDPNEQVV